MNVRCGNKFIHLQLRFVQIKTLWNVKTLQLISRELTWLCDPKLFVGRDLVWIFWGKQRMLSNFCAAIRWFKTKSGNCALDKLRQNLFSLHFKLLWDYLHIWSWKARAINHETQSIILTCLYFSFSSISKFQALHLKSKLSPIISHKTQITIPIAFNKSSKSILANFYFKRRRSFFYTIPHNSNFRPLIHIHNPSRVQGKRSRERKESGCINYPR